MEPRKPTPEIIKFFNSEAHKNLQKELKEIDELFEKKLGINLNDNQVETKKTKKTKKT
jgi:hypothetical protein